MILRNPTFGIWELPGAIQSIQEPVSHRLRTAEVSRGAKVSQGAQLAEKRITIRAIVRCTSEADRREKWEDVVSGLAPPAAPLRLAPVWENDVATGRFYIAEVEQITDERPATSFRLGYEAQFIVPSGVAFDDALTTVALGTGGGSVPNVAGTDDALPAISVTVSELGSGGAGRVSVINQNTGQFWTLAPSETGVYVVDAQDETILRGAVGGVDATGDWVAGGFFRLKRGETNTVVIAATGGLTVSAASLVYRARYR